MNEVLSILLGLVVALIILWSFGTPETFVQAPIAHQPMEISDEDRMLIAVGLETGAPAPSPPSVMDSSQMSASEWANRQAAMNDQGAPPMGPGAAAVQGSGPLPSGGARAGGGGTGPSGGAGSALSTTQTQVLTGPMAAGVQMASAPPPSAPPPGAPALTQEKKLAMALEQSNQLSQAQSDQGISAANLAKQQQLTSQYENDFVNTWLTSSNNTVTGATRTADNKTTRAAYTAWLMAQYNRDLLNFNNSFQTQWVAQNGQFTPGSAQQNAFLTAQSAAQADLQTRLAVIQNMQPNPNFKANSPSPSNWADTSKLDCYQVPWGTSSGNFSDLNANNYDSATQCSTNCGWGKTTVTAKYIKPSNGGQACPTNKATKVFDCLGGTPAHACAYSSAPAKASCDSVSGYSYNAADNKCIKVSSIPTSQGCNTSGGWTYNGASGMCQKAGQTAINPSCEAGYTWNATRKQCEINPPQNPTWGCSTPGFTASTGFFSSAVPTCTGYV
jgi:hypothetical protein